MIHWFIVDAIGWVADRFGYETYARSHTGAWGADGIAFRKHEPDDQPLRKLKARR